MSSKKRLFEYEMHLPTHDFRGTFVRFPVSYRPFQQERVFPPIFRSPHLDLRMKKKHGETGPKAPKQPIGLDSGFVYTIVNGFGGNLLPEILGRNIYKQFDETSMNLMTT